MLSIWQQKESRLLAALVRMSGLHEISQLLLQGVGWKAEEEVNAFLSAEDIEEIFFPFVP